MTAAVAAAPRSIYEQRVILPPDERPIVGRQPAVLHVIPSKPCPWYGRITGEVETTAMAVSGGDRFTTQQLDQLARRGLDPATVKTILVRRHASDREVYTPLRQFPPVYAFDCPVILTGRAAPADKVRVIAPNGEAKLIRSDGWAHTPPRRPIEDFYSNRWSY